jgi:tRNA(Ile)-lysidine synthase
MDASTHEPTEPTRLANWRQDDLVARILRRWRMLTGDKQTRDDERRTLVACSAGADSVVLAFAISRVPQSCVIAHIEHDIRPPEHTQADSAFVRSLAQQWGVPFTHASVQVRSKPGNLEANARSARYAALQQLAFEHNCPFIASAHHADDQLETLLMNLMRGSGIRAMSGMQGVTPLDQTTLIRPMLDITRDEIVELLQRTSIDWREDETNSDISLTRNRIRHQLLPVMRLIDPRIAEHASQWASDLSQVESLINEQVETVINCAERAQSAWRWSRDMFRDQSELILGCLPHEYVVRAMERVGLDSITRRSIVAWVRSVKSNDTDPAIHRIGPIVSRVDAHSVTLEPANDTQQDSGVL